MDSFGKQNVFWEYVVIIPNAVWVMQVHCKEKRKNIMISSVRCVGAGGNRCRGADTEDKLQNTSITNHAGNILGVADGIQVGFTKFTFVAQYVAAF